MNRFHDFGFQGKRCFICGKVIEPHEKSKVQKITVNGKRVKVCPTCVSNVKRFVNMDYKQFVRCKK